MKIIILGSKGNLGHQLYKIFNQNNDYQIFAWDRDDCDITDKKEITDKINKIKPDIIINATAYNAVDKCEESEKEYLLAQKINGKAVGFLSNIAINNNCILVHYSTDYIFGGDKKDGYREDDKPNPINNYGRSKLMGEQELLKRPGLKFYLIRVSKLFGPQGESEIAKESFFDLMKKLAKEKEELDVVDEEVSLFTYTPDLAEATKKLIEAKKDFGIYHLPNRGAPVTWYKAAQKLFKILGKNIKINPVKANKFPRPAKRPAYSVLLNTKFKELRSWTESLAEYLKK